MNPLAFVNKRGFAWNFEEGWRYGEMQQYLKDRQIKYIDIELPTTETMLEHVDNLEVFYNMFKKKYNDY